MSGIPSPMRSSPGKQPARLHRIDPGDLAKILGLAAFVLSLPVAVFALLFSGPGRTTSLNGFFTYRTTGDINALVVMAYPFINALGGLMTGFILAWLYNALARRFGGVRMALGE